MGELSEGAKERTKRKSEIRERNGWN